ncbi:hypothetical protein [Psychroflexus salis]|uniref:Uncharacterized protein n=1 Tax=Psychroflexus salis TaxID=1526574 RepID=A0A917E6F5_9FLAO|nr:hypothetical protein [Psychroflexus salis]GGE05162.1 hypothetical protein GCM10010831_03530 [Psychroflexus salis]
MSKQIKSIIITSLVFFCTLSPLIVVSQGLGGPPTPDPGFDDDVDDEIVPINSLLLLSLVAGGVYGIRKLNQKEK